MGPGILKWVIMLRPLAFVMVLSFGINRLSTGTAQLLFWAFATVMGLSMASIFLVYTGSSIAMTFFATAAAFAVAQPLRLHDEARPVGLRHLPDHGRGRPDRGDAAQPVRSSRRSMNLAISAIGVLIFAGLTAYDTQRIKSMYFTSPEPT